MIDSNALGNSRFLSYAIFRLSSYLWDYASLWYISFLISMIHECFRPKSTIFLRIYIYIYIYIRRTRDAGHHCWRSKDELVSDVLLWIPTYGQAKAGRPAWTYIQQLCEDTECNPEDLPEAMNDREKWREMVRDIHAGGTTSWRWWYIYIYITWTLTLKLLNILKKRFQKIKKGFSTNQENSINTTKFTHFHTWCSGGDENMLYSHICRFTSTYVHIYM